MQYKIVDEKISSFLKNLKNWTWFSYDLAYSIQDKTLAIIKYIF